VNEGTNCDRIRQQWMAALDGEADAASAEAAQHMSTCQACQQWQLAFESMRGRLHALSYPAAEIDVWTTMRDRMHAPETGRTLTHRLLIIGALVFAWRALQLFVDLPWPLLHPLVPIAAAIAAVWQIAGDPLAIVTVAPELQKRGV
jgi:anti-sigma factor RsiW